MGGNLYMGDINELKVKQFQCPTFDEWYKMDEWIGSVGVFNCKIAVTAWSSNYTIYTVAVSIASNPTNIYSPIIFRENLNLRSGESVDTLKTWYNRMTLKVNDMFSEYILKSYIDGYRKENATNL